jgi:predicted ATP-dependent protease
LTGSHGVLIPEKNLPDLMLREDVIEAIRRRNFHVYTVRSIDDGVEILTGTKAGKQRPDGTFEPNTVNALAAKKLQVYAEDWRAFEAVRKS